MRALETTDLVQLSTLTESRLAGVRLTKHTDVWEQVLARCEARFLAKSCRLIMCDAVIRQDGRRRRTESRVSTRPSQRACTEVGRVAT